MSKETYYESHLSSNVMVPMRDGTRLATDIYRPAKDGNSIQEPLPTILGRTSYDKTWTELWIEPVADFFTPRGYVVAIQDLRGRYNSEGTGQYQHTANPKEGIDGFDTIEWIASQSWSNGKVGMVGSSHSGIVQTIASLYRPPHLSALWVDVAPTNIFMHEAREGGAMGLGMLYALFLHSYDSQEIRNDPNARREILEGWENIEHYLNNMPFQPGKTPIKHVPNLEKILFHYYRDGEYNDFWAQDACNQDAFFYKAADIPAVFSSGWYDGFSIAASNQYASMSMRNTSPQRLLIGPWNHGGLRVGESYTGDVDFGSSAAYGNEKYNQLRLSWFDHWLRDISNGIESCPPVKIFVMGGGTGIPNREGRLDHGGKWRDENEWPLARTTYSRMYLDKDGFLNWSMPNELEASKSFNYDPENPVPTISSNALGMLKLAKGSENDNEKDGRIFHRLNPLFIAGASHQKEEPRHFGSKPPYPLIENRFDVLTFRSRPLESDMEITGEIEVLLWISSTSIDTDFTAKLIDLYPPSESYVNGYAMNLTDSIIRTRFRNGYGESEMMTPGEVYEVHIKLPPTSNVFRKGNCIRLDISSSSFPKYDVNPNTGEPLGCHTKAVKAENTIHVNRKYHSFIRLPIIPNRI